MVDQGRGFEQVVLVFGVEHHRVDVGAGEGPDGGFAVPDAEGDHLHPWCAVVSLTVALAGVRVHVHVRVHLEVAGEDHGEPAALSLSVLRDPGVVHVGDVVGLTVAGDHTPPYSGDHDCSKVLL